MGENLFSSLEGQAGSADGQNCVPLLYIWFDAILA